MNKLKKLIAIILCFIMVMGSFAFAEEIQVISADVKDYEGHWAQPTIQKWVDGGKMSGYPDGTFKPDGNITRAEFVKLVNSLIDYDTKGKIAFEDVKQGDWFYDLVSIANEIGYITGYSQKQFGPNDNITREQAAAILARIQYLDDNAKGLEKYSDKNSISSWALGGVGAASNASFISGYDDGSFKPANYLTRAEAVTMLDNVMINAKNYVVYKAGTELKDKVIDGDLIIAKTVGEGDVHLENLDIKGQVKVYGGGENSLYFNNVKVNKVIVEKDNVRLVLDNGTVINEISIGKDTILENNGGEVAKVIITSDGKVTLSGNFKEVTISGNAEIVLNDAKIETLTVEKSIVISGTGTIAKLIANSDGIRYEAKITIKNIVLGKGVTEEPAKTEESSSHSRTDSEPSNPPVETKYSLSFNSKLEKYGETEDISNITYTTPYDYKGTDNIYTIVDEQVDIISTDLNTSTSAVYSKINDAITQINSNANKTEIIRIAGDLWDRIDEDISGTAISANLTDKSLIDEFLDEDITINGDVIGLINLYQGTYTSYDIAESDLNKFADIFEEKINTVDFASEDVSFNIKFKTYNYTLENKNELIDVLDDVLEKVSSDDKFTIDEFKSIFGNSVIIETVKGGYTSTFTVTIN